MNAVKQFKIETPIGSIESDSGNHLVDIGTVLTILIVFMLIFKYKKKGGSNV